MNLAKVVDLGIEYFIHKPINKIEIVTVLRKVKERIELETSIGDIQHSLSRLIQRNEPKKSGPGSVREKSIKETGKFLLSELGIVGESGAHDLMAVLHYLFEDEQAERNIPSLKQMFTNAATAAATPAANKKETIN